MSNPPRRSALGLMVLGFLNTEPSHAYRIQKLLLATGKQRVVNIKQRASIYQAIERLERLGLLQVRESARSAGHPDRTVYEITAAGRETARAWLRDMLSEADPQFPEFAAAVSVVTMLEPDDARQQLEQRAAAIAAELADVEAVLALETTVPRLFQLEEEYRRAVLAAQLDWTRTVIDDLSSGRLTWSEEWLRQIVTTHLPNDSEE